MIDPQTQANKWLKKLLRNRSKNNVASDNDEGTSNFLGTEYVVINATTPEDDGKEDGDGVNKKKKNNSQKQFEFAIQHGQTVLYEEVGEDLDPGLDPIFMKAIY